MRRWCAAGCAGWAMVFVFAGASPKVVARGEYSYETDTPYAVEGQLGAIPVFSEWIGAEDGFLNDTTRWTLGHLFPSNLVIGRVRAVGQPYTITASSTTFWRSLLGLSSGASFDVRGVIRASDSIDIQGPVSTPIGGNGVNVGMAAPRITLRGPLNIESPMGFIGGHSAPTTELLITGTALIRPHGTIGSFEVSGTLRNEGVIEVSGRIPNKSVGIVIRSGELLNRGTLRYTRGVGDGWRTISGTLRNEGDLVINADVLTPFTSGQPVFPVINAGHFLIEEDALLWIVPYARFEQRDGVLEAIGRLTIENSAVVVAGGLATGDIEVIESPIELSGGAVDGGFRATGCEVTITGEQASGRLRLEGVNTVTGDIGPGLTLALGTRQESQQTIYADVSWSGALNRGRIEARESSSNRFTAAGSIINEGEIYVSQGRVFGDVQSTGLVQLGLFALLGGPGDAHVFDGAIDVEPFARAQVGGASALVRGTLRVQPTVAAFLPGYQNQVSFSGALTIDGATLSIDPGPGFAPAWGNIYNLIGASNVTGDFASVEAAPLPDPLWRWEIERYGGSYRGRIAHVADVNRDLGIDFADINAVVAAWGSATGGAADVDGDGVVGFGDLAIVVAHFGQYAD